MVSLSGFSSSSLLLAAASVPRGSDGAGNAGVGLKVGAGGVLDAADKSVDPSKGLYKGADGVFYLGAAGLADGASLGPDAVSLTSKSNAWTPGKAVATALRVTSTGFDVLLKLGDGEKASYAIQSFDTNGRTVDKISKLASAGIFVAENAFDQDISGDGFKGDLVSKVIDAENSSKAPNIGLYELSSGRFAVDVNGKAASAATSSSAIYLSSKGKNWSAGKLEAVAIRAADSGFEVLLKTGSSSKTSYSIQAFDANGEVVGKAIKLSTVNLLNAENSFDQDFTNDGFKGDVIAKVLDAANDVGGAAKYGIYNLTSGRIVVDVNNSSVSDATSKSAVFLTNKGKAWTSGGSVALAVRAERGNFEILLKSGDGQKAKYSVQSFTGNGEVLGKARGLDPTGIIDAELRFVQDFNADSTLGDFVTKVLDKEDSSNNFGLYAMASGNITIGGNGLSIGAKASANEFLRLTDKGKVWSVGRAVAISLASVGDVNDPSGASIILRSGTGPKSKISEATFDASGALKFKPTPLKASAILEKELGYDQDLNDDGKVGNSAFNIKVNFTGDSKYKPYFVAAAARWSQIILNDLPDMSNQSYNWTNVDGYEALGAKSYGTIDDLLLEAVMYDGGNNGNLGSAGPMAQRADGMPIIGRMRFNTFYMSSMISNKTFGDVILHEMGHVLGLGTRWAPLKNGSGDYVGSAAVQQYSLLTNQTQTSIPVEKGGGPGTAGAHWAEDLFGAELMTGYAENAPPMPLSRVTVGALEDLGYTVSYAMADSFTLNGSLASASSAGSASAASLHQFSCHCLTCEIKLMSDGSIGVELNVSTRTYDA